jgi:hypothetical protein
VIGDLEEHSEFDKEKDKEKPPVKPQVVGRVYLEYQECQRRSRQYIGNIGVKEREARK